MQQATASDDAKVNESIRLQLSKFARSVAPRARPRQGQAPKRAKSFDELAAEADIVTEASLPFGAITQKQKTGPAAPDWQRRYQGRLVRPALAGR